MRFDALALYFLLLAPYLKYYFKHHINRTDKVLSYKENNTV